MRKSSLLMPFILILLTGSIVRGQNQNPRVEAYIQRYQSLAVSEMIRTGVPASITLAQAILESGCGESSLAKASNNHFGIKCKSEWVGEKTYHDDDRRGECFRVYPSVADSYRDHSDFLKHRPYYQDLFLLNPTDYKGWAYGLKKAGYATERNYPQSLIKLIETYNLESYTDLALNKMKNDDNPTDRIAKADQPYSSEAIKELSIDADDSKKRAEVATHRPDNPPTMRVAQTMVQAPSYPVAPFSINQTKVVYAPKGVSLMALASKNHLNFHKLLTLNDLGPTAVLSPGQLIYLEKRPRKGQKEYINSQYGQTLKEIAASQGVALKSLVSYNKTAAETPLAAGQKVYLRGKAPAALQTLSK
ncbi:glycoside hydrolase family 73 protein [Arachidicoccus terrestris]|uniref:glycoside hydrolase family 73 protein n=1 Tax=Arachidicoccus terrestris TaxID=2875539 RepID=UPI001CC71342|nr:glucosaminidase domain-containing protein [Arachidicoccus terrestris]UAY55001.1 glucosaminidase domain-containing protein [Arachidicoccus terrestris]